MIALTEEEQEKFKKELKELTELVIASLMIKELVDGIAKIMSGKK
jgi:hypothetical protein